MTPISSLRVAVLVSTVALAACKGEGGTASLPDLVDPRGAPMWVGAPLDMAALTAGIDADWTEVRRQADELLRSARYAQQAQRWYIPLRGNQDATVYESQPLRHAGVAEAHALGLTGTGQRVAVVDGGFNPQHETIAGRVVNLGDVSGQLVTDQDGRPVGADHGTGVASVIAGDSPSMIGIAPGATLLLASYGPPGDFTWLEHATQFADSWGTVAQNNSWGYPNGRRAIGELSESYQTIFGGSRAPGRRYLDALRTYAQDSVVVFAVSNDHSAVEATVMDALPRFDPRLEAGWLAVMNGVPQMSGDDIERATRISAPCLEAARWCLAADGTWFLATGGSTDSYTPEGEISTGASFAAPMVTGALALLAEAFPDLPPHALRARILATADNTFTEFGQRIEMEVLEGSGITHAYSRDWGHGFLDIAAALQPIGTPMLTLADGGAVAADRPLVLVGGAAGAIVLPPETRAYAVDALGGGFETPVAALIAQARRPVDLRLSGPGVLGEWGGTDAVEVGALRVAALTDADAAGLSVAARLPAGDGVLSLGVTAAQDDGSLMPHGVGADAARLASLDLGWERWTAVGTSVRLGASFGATGTPGLDGGSASFSALSVAASRADVLAPGDRLSLSLAAPVAVTHGEVALTLPVARASSGPVAAAAAPFAYRDTVLDLAPDAREIDLGLRYSAPIDAGGEVWVDAVHAFNHGHVEGADALAVGVGWRVSF